ARRCCRRRRAPSASESFLPSFQLVPATAPVLHLGTVLDPVRDVSPAPAGAGKNVEFYSPLRVLPTRREASNRLRLLQQPRHAPGLGPGDGAGLLDLHQVALVALVLFVVRLVLLRA